VKGKVSRFAETWGVEERSDFLKFCPAFRAGALRAGRRQLAVCGFAGYSRDLPQEARPEGMSQCWQGFFELRRIGEAMRASL